MSQDQLTIMVCIQLQKSFLITPYLALIGTIPVAQATSTSEDDAFDSRLDDLEERYEGEINDLRFEIDLLHSRLDENDKASSTPLSPTAFNPLISVVGTLLSRTDNLTILNDEGDAIDDSFRLSEVELDFRSAIDPWADGVVIGAIESEATGEYAFGIEEGYVVLKRLPFTEWTPLGMSLKVGRFRTAFGRINKVHTHNLPWSTRPLAVTQFLGHEGYLREGISGAFHLPAPSKSDSINLTVEMLSGGGIAIDKEAPASHYAPLGHLAWFRELNAEHTLEVGLSARGGNRERALYGADFTYAWKPLGGGEWNSFIFGGEYFLNDSDVPELDRARGSYLWAQNQLSRQLYLGARYDFVEELGDRSMDTTRSGLWLSYYTSEFLRLRAGVEHTNSDLAEIDGLKSVFVELSFVFGAHGSDPYWVNR
ncbi:MAG: hypothetical protein ACI8TQ_000640 [Planctomycetota bacterium]|jgi:hypothetical protein